jgi:phage shock protein PspC (stress-responsive transcriptional regulator)
MQKVVHASLGGNAYVLEEEGYEALRAYLDAAGAALAADPDRQEILGDLEQAIGEKCRRHVSPHKSVVTAEEMARVLAEMGPVAPAASAPEPPPGAATGTGTTPGGPVGPAPGAPPPRAEPSEPPGAPPPRRLYRILEGGVLGGLCNGLGAYFRIDANVVRAIFVVLALLTHGAWLLVYLVLLFVVPTAGTAEERAAARGIPFSAQALIDQAKRHYARLERELHEHAPWKHGRREWREAKDELKREWRRERDELKREWRARRREWRREVRRDWWGAHAKRDEGGAPPSYGEQVAAGFVVPVLSFLSAALLVAWVVGTASLLQTGKLLGWAPGLPLWGSLLLLLVAFSVVGGPISHARRALHREARGGWILAAWDGLLWLGFLALLGWLAWRYSPELRAVAHDLGGALDRVVASLPSRAKPGP